MSSSSIVNNDSVAGKHMPKFHAYDRFGRIEEVEMVRNVPLLLHLNLQAHVVLSIPPPL
jgi:hypothetical protein